MRKNSKSKSKCWVEVMKKNTRRRQNPPQPLPPALTGGGAAQVAQADPCQRDTVIAPCQKESVPNPCQKDELYKKVVVKERVPT